MHLVLQLLFLVCLAIAVFFFSKKVMEIKRNIFLGQPLKLQGDWSNVVLLAFGQKKMFSNWPVAVLHFFVYAGFIIINAEIFEIVLDGLLGTHRLFFPALGGLYTVLINCFEVLALLVLIAVIIFFIRRNITRVKRLVSADLNGFPRKDANIILYIEVVLMSLFLLMNAADTELQTRGVAHYAQTGGFAVSQYLQGIFTSVPTGLLVSLERGFWWLHILGIFAFLNYLPYSKHLHIVLAFPNAYYAPKASASLGEMSNMPSIQNEILYMMEPEKAPASAEDATLQKFGARDIFDLSWKNLMDAYSCTECGRCSAACPANATGKKLSPRAIMMKTRDRIEEVGAVLNAGKGEWKDDGKTLLNDYISAEELSACTTCNACVQECPVSISPLSIITELRRCLVMEDSKVGTEWQMMFSNIENNMAPWKMSPSDRDQWRHDV
jgi:heterodisulfide reductase subunit C